MQSRFLTKLESWQFLILVKELGQSEDPYNGDLYPILIPHNNLGSHQQILTCLLLFHCPLHLSRTGGPSWHLSRTGGLSWSSPHLHEEDTYSEDPRPQDLLHGLQIVVTLSDIILILL